MRNGKMIVGPVACLSFLLCVATLGFAQEKPKPAGTDAAAPPADSKSGTSNEKKPAAPAATDKSADKAPKNAELKKSEDASLRLPPRRRASGSADYTNRRIVQLRRLLKGLKEGIKLDSEQVQQLDREFEEYFAYCRAGKYKIKTDSMPSPRDPRLPLELRELYQAVEKAEKSNDLDELRRAHEALDNYFASHPPVAPFRDQRFVGEVGSLLKPDQIDAFKTIEYRWSRLNTRLPGDDALRRLDRALKDPELKFSEEMSEKMRQIIVDARQSTGKLGARNPDLIEPAAEKAKEKAFAMLTPEQKKIVESTLQMFKEDDVVFAQAMHSASVEKQKPAAPPADGPRKPGDSTAPVNGKADPGKSSAGEPPKPQKD